MGCHALHHPLRGGSVPWAQERGNLRQRKDRQFPICFGRMAKRYRRGERSCVRVDDLSPAGSFESMPGDGPRCNQGEEGISAQGTDAASSILTILAWRRNRGAQAVVVSNLTLTC